MTTTTCAISGIVFHTPEFSALNVPIQAGYFHPVFTAPRTRLLALYRAHSAGQLTTNESYLLYLALANSTGLVDWQRPIAKPAPAKLAIFLENSIAQLVTAITRSEAITHPSFKQPKLTINRQHCTLNIIANWRSTLNDNVKDFHAYRNDMASIEAENAAAKALLLAIRSPKQDAEYTHLVADWAAKAGDFPPEKSATYRATIVACFSPEKMHNVSLTLLREIRDYCEANIEVGSVHFNKLTSVLSAGVRNHIDYLGVSHLVAEYKLEDSDTFNSAYIQNKLAKEKIGRDAAEAIVQSAPTSMPLESQYSNKMDYLKAKLAYRLAKAQPTTTKAHTTSTATPINKESINEH